MSATELERSPTPPGSISMQALSSAVTSAQLDALLNECDSVLVHLARQDISAFEQLYERYRDHIFRYCFRGLGNWDDASDATQQTFTNALAGLPHFQDKHDSFRSWIYQIAHNEVINRHRQRTRRPLRDLVEADWIADPAASPEELAILADAHARVHILLLRLTPEQRRCCEMRFSGLSHRETAAALGKSEVAVRASFRRGLAVLRDLMGEDR